MKIKHYKYSQVREETDIEIDVSKIPKAMYELDYDEEKVIVYKLDYMRQVPNRNEIDVIYKTSEGETFIAVASEYAGYFMFDDKWMRERADLDSYINSCRYRIRDKKADIKSMRELLNLEKKLLAQLKELKK